MLVRFYMKQIAMLAVPLVLSQLTAVLTRLMGMLMIAKLGPTELAASALVSSFYLVLVLAGLGVLFSVSIMVGKSHGEQNIEAVCGFVRHGFLLSTIISIPVMAVTAFMAPILHLFGQTPAITKLAGHYMFFITFSILPTFWVGVFNQFTSAISLPKYVMIWSLTNLIFSVLFGYALIFGKLSFPAYGMSGFALATAIVSWINFFVVAVIFYTSKVYRPYRKIVSLRFQSFYLKLLAKTGWPISLQFGGELGAFAVITILMGLISADALGAQQIIQQTRSFVYMIPLALTQTTGILVGQYSGKRDFNSVRNFCTNSLLLGLLVMLIITSFYVFFPMSLASIFIGGYVDKFDILHMVTILFIIAAINQIIDAVRNIATGGLRGLRDTRTPMYIGLLSLWLIGIPCSLLFAFVFKWGAVGLPLGLMFGLLVATIILLNRLHKKISYVCESAISHPINENF